MTYSIMLMLLGAALLCIGVWMAYEPSRPPATATLPDIPVAKDPEPKSADIRIVKKADNCFEVQIFKAYPHWEPVVGFNTIEEARARVEMVEKIRSQHEEVVK